MLNLIGRHKDNFISFLVTLILNIKSCKFNRKTDLYRMYAKGKKGELIAERYLVNQGYQIHFRNKRVGRNEIDLICEKEETIIFVEVKSLTATPLLKPYESVNRAKQNKILKVANDVALRHFPEHNYRFDIISIVFRQKEFDIEHIKNAFTSEITNR